MKLYLGTKLISAIAMSLVEYHHLRGWKMPEDQENEEGYLVEYKDGGKPNHPNFEGYISWSPKVQFENAYRVIDGMSFGLAIEAMKMGRKVFRAGWNGKGMFLYYVPANKYPASGNKLNTMKGIFPDDMVPYAAYIAMKTAQNDVVPWLASQTDMLADDWRIV